MSDGDVETHTVERRRASRFDALPQGWLCWMSEKPITDDQSRNQAPLLATLQLSTPIFRTFEGCIWCVHLLPRLVPIPRQGEVAGNVGEKERQRKCGTTSRKRYDVPPPRLCAID